MVTLARDSDVRTIAVKHLHVGEEDPPQRVVRCEIDGRSYRVGIVDTCETTFATAAGRSWNLVRPNPLARRARASNGAVVAPLSGRVVSVTAQLGAQVRAGEVLIVIEAMKMEHRLCAGADGRIEQIEVRVGDQTRVGQILARVVTASEASAGESNG